MSSLPSLSLPPLQVTPERAPSLQESPPQARSRGYILGWTQQLSPRLTQHRVCLEAAARGWGFHRRPVNRLPVLFVLEAPTPPHTSRDWPRAKLERGFTGCYTVAPLSHLHMGRQWHGRSKALPKVTQWLVLSQDQKPVGEKDENLHSGSSGLSPGLPCEAGGPIFKAEI